jgi:tripartite-type tricarboxylate transporter receptor subunit TctC
MPILSGERKFPWLPLLPPVWNRNVLIGVVRIIGLIGLLATSAAAAEFPERTVKTIVPFPPGGSSDGPARVFLAGLGKHAGQTFYVDNRAGAGGAIRSLEAMRANSDGYTLLVSTGTLSVISALSKKAPFDAVRDFAHVAAFATMPLVVVVNKDKVPFKTLDEFIAASKSGPGKYLYASGGIGSTAQLGAERIKQTFKIDWQHVPYRGTGPALIDLIAGQVDVSVVGLSSVLGYIENGTLRALAVTSPSRAPQLPQVPTVAESSPGFELEFWLGIHYRQSRPGPSLNEWINSFNRLFQIRTFRVN